MPIFEELLGRGWKPRREKSVGVRGLRRDMRWVVLGVCLGKERLWVGYGGGGGGEKGGVENVECRDEKDETRDQRTKGVQLVESIILYQQNECEGMGNREGR